MLLIAQTNPTMNLPIATIQRARIARDPRFDGLFFVAVKTTGIFCRPICRARMPLEKNVDYYASAIQAMDQGFRPCLMCRPDSAPGSFAWKGVETTVERGVKLLSSRLSLNIAEISEKLGISTRYFNRLFEQHLQISPKRYQLLNRLLFAKQLLHESTLPIEQVAHACGFNAAKPLQHHMKANTGLTPSQIRRANSLKGGNEGSEIIVYLSYRPPYQWSHIQAFFKLREIHSNEFVDDSSISKVIKVGGQNVLFKALHQAEQNRFEVRFLLSDLSVLKGSIGVVKKMLDLSCDPHAIASSLKQSGMPESMLRSGIRLPGINDRFEAGCRAIVGQQVTVKAAIGQLNLLQNTLAKRANPDDLIAFVSPARVAGADLSFLKMPNARKATLKAFAEFMTQRPNASIAEWLTIKGIGTWTVNYVNMRHSDNPDVFLATDLVVKNKLKKLAEQQVNIDADTAAPWRSYLTLNLWDL